MPAQLVALPWHCARAKLPCIAQALCFLYRSALGGLCRSLPFSRALSLPVFLPQLHTYMFRCRALCHLVVAISATSLSRSLPPTQTAEFSNSQSTTQQTLDFVASNVVDLTSPGRVAEPLFRKAAQQLFHPVTNLWRADEFYQCTYLINNLEDLANRSL